MTDHPRIVFVNRFYWPDEPATAQLLTDLAEGLAASGFRVTIVTSRPAKHAVPDRETKNGVEIIRVRGPRLGRRNLLLRAIDFVGFALGSLRCISKLLKPNDILVVMTDPPLLGIPATAIARRRRARLVHWIQDVYPEIAAAVGGTRLVHLFRRFRDRAWRNADACVALGTDMAAFAASRGVAPNQISIIPNWAPAGLIPLPPSVAKDQRSLWDLHDKFIVLYSGNLGRVHNLAPVLAIAHELRFETDIVFLFVGDGAQKRYLQTKAAQQGLTNIKFQPAQPRNLLGKTLALGDLHLVTLRQGCEQLVFPSKFYGISAVGRPIVFIGPKSCELAHLVTHHSFGLAFSGDDITGSSTAIRDLRDSPERCSAMNFAAAQFYTRNGGLGHAVASWSSLLKRLMPLAATKHTPQN